MGIGFEALYLNALFHGDRTFVGKVYKWNRLFVVAMYLESSRWTRQTIERDIEERLVRASLANASFTNR